MYVWYTHNKVLCRCWWLCFSVFSFKKATQFSPKDNSSFLYAVAPSEGDEDTDNNNVLLSAHELTLAKWRDAIRNNDTEQIAKCTKPAQDIVAQSLESNDDWQNRWNMYHTPTSDLGSASVSRASAPTAFGKKKTVTAASFFGKSAKSSSTSTNTQQKSKSTLSSDSQTVKKKSVANSMFQKKTAQEEKENKHNKQRTESKPAVEKKVVGNADDFVGDDESSDDESVNPVEVPPSPKKRDQPDVNENDETAQVEEIDLMDVDQDPKKEENMETESSPAPKKRGRRKKLVQKTSVDSKGYFHTETQEIWEDIPSDEEPERIKPKKTTKKLAAPAKKKAKGMKQGSIGSFFAKK